jgi:sucrose-6F-phosphate phosphohydrolase
MESAQRLLLCTDLDRTLIPNGREPESPHARRLFDELVARREVTLVYVSGRHAALVREAIAAYDLPAPQRVIADVGTAIYETGAEEWTRSASWEAEIRRGWPADAGRRLVPELAKLPGCEPQEASRQSDVKLSFYVSRDLDAGDLTRRVESTCRALGVSPSIIYSVDEQRSVGLLDVLPARASKLHAIRFLMQELGFSLLDTLFCGDSGNDLDVLTSEIPGVLVANAAPEVRSLAIERASRLGNADKLYIARGSFLDMNGNYAAGILEGVAHFHPHAFD